MTTTLGQRLVAGNDQPLLLLLRVLLLPLTALYLLIVSVRNALYDAGLLTAREVGVPVVSVGNITVGGTGKTPLVIHLANAANAAGRKVFVVTTGYGAKVGGEGDSDEVALIRDRCPGVEVLVAPDKGLGARQAAAAGAELIFVDDGFQARHLHRDLDIAVVDARAPFSNNWVLPGGGLREPPAGIGRADAIVMTHFDGLSDERLDEVQHRVRAYNRKAPIVLASHVPTGVRPVTGGELQDPAVLAGQEVFLFCGIASPEGFRDTVEELGATVTGVEAFGDHHAFDAADVAKVRGLARTARLVCTEKDAQKIASIPGHEDVLCVVIELVLHGESPLELLG